MPGIADKFTQSAQGRLRRPGMTSFTTETDFIGCFLSQTVRRPGSFLSADIGDRQALRR
jgi:hypothetical protein